MPVPIGPATFIAVFLIWAALWAANKAMGVLRDIVLPSWRTRLEEERVAATSATATSGTTATTAATAETATTPARRTPRLLAPAEPPATSPAGRGSMDRANRTRDQSAPEMRPRLLDVRGADLRPRRVGTPHARPDSYGEPREDHHVASAAATSVSSLRPLCSLPAQPPLLCPPRRAAPADQLDDLLSPDSSPAVSPVVGDPRIAVRRGLDMDAFWEDHGWTSDSEDDHFIMRPQVGRGRTEPHLTPAAARAKRQAENLSSQR
jgi:hypothetical protein